MYNTENLYDKLREIEALIQERTNPDGSCDFNIEQVLIGLELARRMITQEKSE